MRLLSFEYEGSTRLGVRSGDRVVDLSVAAPDLPQDLLSLLRAGPEAMARAGAAAAAATPTLALADLSLAVPIADPPKILCLSLIHI